ncbi:glycosyl hydrolase family 95 catalytic domain-containing protein [Schleiferilactobacillus harbinensis]|uniref:Glycoside hydrolase N-terminal domain-containing protein n=1 Tax=Schleiferilactobacillus harbinensis TaxID=304207 RepID=A0ABU7T1Q8_9LACO
MSIWSPTPAQNWESYYPLGSGRLGAMISGDTRENNIILNDDRLFSAPRNHRVNPDAAVHAAKVHDLLFADKVIEAEELAGPTMFAAPTKQATYEVLGLLKIRNRYVDYFEQPTAYRRSLDLNTALYTQEYTGRQDGNTFEAFTALADHALYGHYTATNNVLALNFTLTRPEERYERVHRLDDHTILISGHSDGLHGRHFGIKLSVFAPSGFVTVYGNTILVSEAHDCWFRVTSAVVPTSDPFYPDFAQQVPVTASTYAGVKKRNIAAYQALYQRTDFSLPDDPDLAQLPTADRLAQMKQGSTTDPGLIVELFNYGKYLLIASSEPGTNPANLQGIWNQDLIPLWGSKYTININTEMNYWLTGPLNYDVQAEPLVDLFLLAVERGRNTAKTMYGLAGSVIHHNLDIYGDGAPQSTTMSATLWPLGGVWLANELWRHYQFSRDDALLKRIYPAFKELAAFYNAFLAKDPDGYFAAAPSVSPENYYVFAGHYFAALSYGTTIDNSLLREFYGALIWMAQHLEKDADLRISWQEVLDQIRPTAIAADGRIREYVHDYPETDKGHRHFSPLYGLFPGDEFTTPELKAAARKFLDYRLQNGGGQTGWSLAWAINLFARLGDGEAAWQAINRMFTQSTQDNLLNSHPPFQIDGNFGFSNAIAEMIVQSTPTEITLFPALPAAWSTGHLTGVRTRAGVILDVAWANGHLTEYKIHGTLPADVTVYVAPQYLDANQPNPLEKEGHDHG